MRRAMLLASSLWLLDARPSAAFVPTPVGGHPGELDLHLQLGIEGGKIEPNENGDSFQRARGYDALQFIDYLLHNSAADNDKILLSGTMDPNASIPAVNVAYPQTLAEHCKP